jgi:arsenate reductase
MADRTHILFLCVGNACRSQIAAGLIEVLAGDAFVAFSAGVRPAGLVHPLAKRVVGEVGGSLDDASSKGLEKFLGAGAPRIDIAVSLSRRASRRYRTSRIGAPLIEWPIADPIAVEGNDEDRLTAFRWVRDEICIRLEDAIAAGALVAKPRASARRFEKLRSLFSDDKG